MIRSIVVPLDGSRFAETAIGVASRVARAAGAKLSLVLVHEPVMAMVPAADIPVSAGPDDLEVRAQQQTYLADAASRLGTIGSAPVGYEVVDGLAGPTLAGWIEKHQPDLVVMATHGRGPLSRFWLGSVADHLIRHVTVPVLMIRPQDGDAIPVVDYRLSAAVVPVDLSEESAAILESLKDFAVAMDTHVTLMHVIEPVLGISGAVPPYPVPVPQDVLESTRVQAQKLLDEMADKLRASGIRVATKVFVGLGVAGSVLHEVNEGKADFVAMTTHGAGGFRRLMLGSVADKVIRASTKPVLVLRPRGITP